MEAFTLKYRRGESLQLAATRKPARTRSSATSTTRSFRWNDAFHRNLGLERQKFWLLACQETFDRDSILTQLAQSFKNRGIHSYIVWELFGEQDFLIRTWLPPDVDTAAIDRDLAEIGRSVALCDVDETIYHWMWEGVELDSDDLFKDVTIESLLDINDPNIGEATLDRYKSKGFLRPLHSGPHSLKFFIFLWREQNLSQQLELKYQERLRATAGAFKKLSSWSLYKVRSPQNFYRYVLSGRVEPSDFESITTHFNAEINAGTGGAVVGSKTITYLATTAEPRFRVESIRPFGLSSSTAMRDASEKDPETSSPTPIESLLLHPEGNQLEVKGSGFVDLKRKIHTSVTVRDIDVTASVVKTIVGFLNTDGGTLIIGAVEEVDFYSDIEKLNASFGQVPTIGDYLLLGVQHEYGKKAFDGYQRSVRDAIGNYVDPSSLAQRRIDIQRVTVEGRDLCIVSCRESTDGPIYAIEEGGRNYRFYVREGNRTLELKGSERDRYLGSRFEKHD